MNVSKIIVCLTVLVCLLAAQTNLSGPPLKVVSVGYTARSGSALETGMLAVKGKKVATSDSLVTCRGSCELTVHNVTIGADHLSLYRNTGEAEARGNVRVVVVPHASQSAQK